MESNKEYLRLKEWFDKGCDISEGVKLHYALSKNYQNKKKLALNVSKRKILLKSFMLELLELYRPKTVKKDVIQKPEKTKKIVNINVFERIKSEFPKLNFKELPDTLKLLIFKRYDLWIESKYQYAAQQKAENKDERFEAAKATVLAVRENWIIWEEVNHYHKFGKILGKHPKFSETDFLEEIKELEKGPVLAYTKEFNLILRRARNNINRLLQIRKTIGFLDDKQTEILNLWVYKFNIVAEKLNEPKWEK